MDCLVSIFVLFCANFESVKFLKTVVKSLTYSHLVGPGPAVTALKMSCLLAEQALIPQFLTVLQLSAILAAFHWLAPAFWYLCWLGESHNGLSLEPNDFWVEGDNYFPLLCSGSSSPECCLPSLHPELTVVFCSTVAHQDTQSSHRAVPHPTCPSLYGCKSAGLCIYPSWIQWGFCCSVPPASVGSSGWHFCISPGKRDLCWFPWLFKDHREKSCCESNHLFLHHWTGCSRTACSSAEMMAASAALRKIRSELLFVN